MLNNLRVDGLSGLACRKVAYRDERLLSWLPTGLRKVVDLVACRGLLRLWTWLPSEIYALSAAKSLTCRTQ